MKTEETKQELTFGQQIIGVDPTVISISDTTLPEVDTTKMICAVLIDTLADSFNNREIAPMHGKIVDHAIMKIVEAQMAIVKALTFNI